MNIQLNIDNLKSLRKETGLSVAACKKALLQVNNNLWLAKKILYKDQIQSARKMLYNKTLEVAFFTFQNNFVYVEIQLNCQTDFVARCETFHYLAEIFAINILLHQNQYIKYIDFDDIPVSKICNIKKNYVFFLQNCLLSSSNIFGTLEPDLKILKEKNQIKINSNNLKKYLLNENTIDTFLLKQISKFGENIKLRKVKAYYSIGDRGI